MMTTLGRSDNRYDPDTIICGEDTIESMVAASSDLAFTEHAHQQFREVARIFDR
jgi:hypothetical protein